MNAKFSDLLGHTIVKIDGGVGDTELLFSLQGNYRYTMLHREDCCENVYVEDICGDLDDIIGSPILLAEECVSLPEACQFEEPDRKQETSRWTFYRLQTIKGSVTIRWYGTSNGYYSETVDFERVLSS